MMSNPFKKTENKGFELNHHKIFIKLTAVPLTALSPAAPSVFQGGREAKLNYVFMGQIFLVPCCLYIYIYTRGVFRPQVNVCQLSSVFKEYTVDAV